MNDLLIENKLKEAAKWWLIGESFYNMDKLLHESEIVQIKSSF